MSKPYAVLHLELDGAIVDRDDGYPDVEFQLHPIGTSLPESEQRHELVIVIDPDAKRPRSTRLATKELRQLFNFLVVHAHMGEDDGG